MHVAENPQMEKIIDKRISKRTQRKTYLKYLVKWKGHPIEDASWESEEDIQKHGHTVQKFMDKSPWIYQPKEYNVGASLASASGGQLDIH